MYNRTRINFSKLATQPLRITALESLRRAGWLSAPYLLKEAFRHCRYARKNPVECRIDVNDQDFGRNAISLVQKPSEIRSRQTRPQQAVDGPSGNPSFSSSDFFTLAYYGRDISVDIPAASEGCQYVRLFAPLRSLHIPLRNQTLAFKNGKTSEPNSDPGSRLRRTFIAKEMMR